MSPLWSKILESIVSELTLKETSQYWKGNQHGGTKGSSTDHVLIEAWDRILRSLDRAADNRAVIFTALDFSKSFSRCTHQEILKSYQSVGASNWLLRMHAAFLENRTMQVKLGTVVSTPQMVIGGAVQGSVLGVLDHNVVLNDLDDELLDIYVAKYVDDMTIIETVTSNFPTTIDTSGSRPLHTIRPSKS